jgi:hypothetical protein
MRIVNARPLERCLACEADRSELDPISSTDAMQSVDNGRRATRYPLLTTASQARQRSKGADRFGRAPTSTADQKLT